jgi:hypothetical protein
MMMMVVVMRASESRGAPAADFGFGGTCILHQCKGLGFAICVLRFAVAASSTASQGGLLLRMVLSIFTRGVILTSSKKEEEEKRLPYPGCWNGMGKRRGGWDGVGLRSPYLFGTAMLRDAYMCVYERRLGRDG